MSLTDTLPAGVTFDSATPTQGTCSESSGTVTCALGTIADGADAGVEITVRPSGPGTLTNQAAVTSDLADPDSADTTASAETTVRSVADLSLTKSDAPDPVLAGELLTYTLGVSNGGPRDATNTTLTDTLPAGVTFDSATPSQGTCSEASGTVTCALGHGRRPAERERRDQGQAAGRRDAHQPGKRRLRRGRLQHCRQLRQRQRRPSTRPPTCR